jgi:hypothetical protein
MNPWTHTPAPDHPAEPPKPANPEPTSAPADPEKSRHVSDPEQGKSEHPRQREPRAGGWHRP